jgi:protoheme IX farnesyltransferase
MSLVTNSTISERAGAAPGVERVSDFAEVRDYFELLKPRVMSLVVFTALVGIVRAPDQLHPVLTFAALLCIAIGAGAAGALNMWWDADIDARMSRTAKRPIPAGRVEPGEALSFGLVLSIGSVLMIGLFAGLLAAALLAFTIFFYAVVYTMWLKRWTPQNIVIGGAAGAFPPMIGWAAVTGSISLESILLFLIIFFWTPPHFWALALLKKEDYARAGVPMLPNVAGEGETRRQILIYSLILAPLSVSPWVLGYAGLAYGVASAALGLIFVALAFEIWRNRSAAASAGAARKLFAYSILYLFLLFAILLVEPLVG